VEEGSRPHRFEDLSLADFVDRLASAEPVPGGGSASAVAGALGAALVTMVASLSIGKAKYASHAELHETAVQTGRTLAERFLRIADRDADAFAAFAAARKMPRESEPELEARRRAMRDAARWAAEVPFECVEACVDLAGIAEALAGRSNVNASSDVAVAANLAEAAARGAAANVVINLPSVDDEGFAGSLIRRVKDHVDEVERLAALARQAALSGDPRPPLPASGK
jgi:formiminotetrahydrofolate cyclodeaminase